VPSPTCNHKVWVPQTTGGPSRTTTWQSTSTWTPTTAVPRGYMSPPPQVPLVRFGGPPQVGPAAKPHGCPRQHGPHHCSPTTHCTPLPRRPTQVAVHVNLGPTTTWLYTSTRTPTIVVPLPCVNVGPPTLVPLHRIDGPLAHVHWAGLLRCPSTNPGAMCRPFVSN
jgi:hypothetical protein